MTKPYEISATTWQETQRELAGQTAGVSLIAAWAVWVAQSATFPRDDRLFAVSVGTVMLVAALTQVPHLPARGLLFAQALVLYLACVLAYTWLGYHQAGILLLVPIMMASLLVSSVTGLVMAAGSQVLFILDPPGWAGGSFACCLGTGMAGAVVVLYGNALRGELDRCFGYCAATAALRGQLATRQEQVNRLNKSLRTANGLLRRTTEELGAAQREAIEARSLKEQFASTVSHELRTPLSIILGFLGVIQQHPSLYGDVNWTPLLRRDLSEIQRSARYLSDLVDDILDLARAQALKMPIHREQSDLASLMEDVKQLTSRLILVDSPVELVLDIPEGLPGIYIDRTRIRQVLLNLVANACRFTVSGRITMRAEASDSDIVVSVHDTGSGIPPHQLGRIFDDYEQGESVQESVMERPGKGLGLAIARRFVQLHGGHIWATSEIGKGSTFSFSLPLDAKQVSQLGAQPLPPAVARHEQPVLVLVDDEEGQALLARHLEGHDVVRAAGIAEARALVQELHPAAVVLNVPPEPEGSVRAAPAVILPEPVPVLQCTLPVGRWYQQTSGFDDWIVKPVDDKRLMAALNAAAPVRRLLVADDDKQFVRLMRRLIGASLPDCAVTGVSSALEALDLLAEQAYDAVLLDIYLPGMSGLEAARILHDRRAQTQGDGPLRPRLIAVTALQPGLEGPSSAPSSFTVTSSTGIAEEATIQLIRTCLAQLRPAYLSPRLAKAPPAGPGA